jgi:hypothetical protein
MCPDDFESVLRQVLVDRAVEHWGVGTAGLGTWLAGGVVIGYGGSAVHIRAGLLWGLRLSPDLVRDLARINKIIEVGSVWLVGGDHDRWKALWGDRCPWSRIRDDQTAYEVLDRFLSSADAVTANLVDQLRGRHDGVGWPADPDAQLGLQMLSDCL